MIILINKKGENMDFEKVIRERKATRSFSDKQVDKESLDKILDFPCN